MEAIIFPALRGILIYVILLILSRVMGRKMISQMTFFDFVVGIMIGSVAAMAAVGPFGNRLDSGITVLIILTALVVLIGYMTIKSYKFRKLIDSEPLVLIEKGQIVDKNLKKGRVTLNDLTTLLRQKNMFNVADVEFALLEYDGKLSVMPKSDKQPLTPKDINIPAKPTGLTKDVILDGSIMKENLKDANVTEDALIKELETSYGIKDVKDVFYAGLDSTGRLYVSKKNTDKETHGKYGIE